MPSFTININGDNYTVGYDGTFNSPQGLLPALNNLGFGTFWIEQVSGNNVLTTTDNVNVYSTAETNSDPTTTTTTSTTTTSTTIAPIPTSTTTSTSTTTTTETSTSTTTTSTTLAPTTSTTTTTTTPAGPTTTSTTTTTTTLFAQTVRYASNQTDACLNPTGTQNVTGNATSFCGCTIFNSAGFVTLPNGNYVLAYSGSTLNINISGFPTTTATVYGGGCGTCPLSTSTTTTSTTLQQVWYQLTNCNGGGTVYTTNYDIGYAIVGDRVFGTVLGVPSTLVVASVLFSNPGGTQIGIVNSGLTGCPASTTTTTTTTTLPPVTLDLTANCTGVTQTITIDNFAGGDGVTYYANDTTYDNPSSASGGATSIIVGGTRTYNNQPNGTRYIYVFSASRNTVKQGGQTDCVTTTSTTTTTTTIQQVWYAMDICDVGGTANSTNYDIGYAAVTDRVFGTVSGTPRTLVVTSVLTSDPGGTQIGITNSGLTGCPTTTSTTTTTTTQAPVNASVNSVCTGITQTITVNNFTGGDGATYYANTTTYADPVSAAAGPVTLVIGGTRDYLNQTNGTRYIYITSTIRTNVVSGGQVCTTTTTTTSTSTSTTSTTFTTSSTTTTTTLPPINVTISSVCTGVTQTISLNSFSGGDETTYFASDTTYSSPALAVAGPTSIIVGGTRSYTNQPNGTRYVYVTSGNVNVIKQDGQTCTTTTSTTTSTTTLPITSTTTTTTTLPITSTTTTTTTLPPVTANISSVCTGITQTITVDTFGGGSGTYFASTTTYGDPASAASGPVTSVSGSRDYTNQPNGTRYVYVTSTGGAPVVKQGGQTCTTTTSTTTSTTTTAPTCTSWNVANFNGFGLTDTVFYVDCAGTSTSQIVNDGNQFDICVLDSGIPTPYMEFGYGSVNTNSTPCT